MDTTLGKGKRKVVPAHAMKIYAGSRGMTPPILNLDTRWRCRWGDNIGMDLQEVGLGYEDWIGLAQDRDRWRALVSSVRNLRVP